MPSILLVLLLTACTTTPEVKEPTPQQIQRAKMMKAKAARRAKMKAKLKAKMGKGGGQGAKARAERVGIAGPMKGELVLTPEGQGETMKTRAQLRMGWEGGQHTAFLGVTAGECQSVEPGKTASGDQAVWWASCAWKEMSADFAIYPKANMVLVQRAITRDGTQGEWVTVRRIPLAEGAQLTAGEVAPAAEAPADAPAEGSPSEAPAPEAPAPAGSPE